MGASKQSSRKRAREARIAADYARVQRDNAREDALIKFFDAGDAAEKIEVELNAQYTAQGAALLTLSELGDSLKSISEMTDKPVARVRELIALAKQASVPEDKPTATATPLSEPVSETGNEPARATV